MPMFSTPLGKVHAEENDDEGDCSQEDNFVKPDFKEVRRRARSHAMLSP